MKPEKKALLFIVAAMVVVAAGGAALFVLVAGSIPETLPVAAGTVFSANETQHWVAHFTVGPSGGRIMGGWTAYRGIGPVYLVVVNGTVSKPWPPPLMLCPHLHAWSQSNGSIDLPVNPGPHTAYWSTGYCSSADEIVVTQTIRLVSA